MPADTISAFGITLELTFESLLVVLVVGGLSLVGLKLLVGLVLYYMKRLALKHFLLATLGGIISLDAVTAESLLGWVPFVGDFLAEFLVVLPPGVVT